MAVYCFYCFLKPISACTSVHIKQYGFKNLTYACMFPTHSCRYTYFIWS